MGVAVGLGELPAHAARDAHLLKRAERTGETHFLVDEKVDNIKVGRCAIVKGRQLITVAL